MIWHAFNVARGMAEDYWDLPTDVVGAHFLLLLACCAANDGKGNCGIWRDSVGWDTRKWLRFTGRTKEEIDRLVSHGLARWITREQGDALVAALTPTVDEIEGERFEWERCRITGAALDEHTAQSVDPDRHTPSIRIDTPGRSGSTRIGTRIDPTDLVVVDFDLGGQVKAQLTSEINSRNAKMRWEAAKQLRLSGLQTDAPTTPKPRIDPRIDEVQQMRSHCTGTVTDTEIGDTPPKPPRVGGASPPAASLDSETAALLDSFWAWFKAARPIGLNTQLWGGAKPDSLRVLVRRTHGRADPLFPQEPVHLRLLLERIKADLSVKFKSEKWITDTVMSGVGFRSYVSKDQWKEELPRGDRPRPRLVEPDPAELERQAAAAVARRAAEEGELRNTWAQEMPGEAFPEDLVEAKRRLREKHGWAT